jgi:plastocyanin
VEVKVKFKKSVKLLTVPIVFLLVAGCSGMTPAATLTPESSPVPNTPVPAPSATEAVAPTDTTVPSETPVPTETLPPPTETPASGTVTVIYQDFEIIPSNLRIKVGTKVTFLIKSDSGDCHEPYSSYPDRTDISGLFDSGALRNGASFSYTFRKAGTITIRCGCHPEMMVATVEVVE